MPCAQVRTRGCDKVARFTARRQTDRGRVEDSPLLGFAPLPSQPLGDFVQRLAFGEKLHHALRFGGGQFCNPFLDRRWQRTVPLDKESHNCSLQAALLAALLAALFPNADEVFAGGSVL